VNPFANFTGHDGGLNRVSSCLLVALTGMLSMAGGESEASDKGLVTRVALGSCADQKKKQPIWDAIVAQSPDLFVFLGDNVYADTEDMDEMRASYAMLAAIPGYQKLRKTCPVLAVWDDHDYGVNDGGAEYPKKAEAAQIFHDFFKTPADSPARRRPGTYDVRYFDGGEGKVLQILLLDTRTFRGPLVAFPQRSTHGPYDRNRDPAVTLLGAEQWKWLEEELAKPADIRFIMTSIQFLPQDHHWELWENLPHERERFLKLLAAKQTGPVIFFSGDRHMGELMKLRTDDPLSPGFPIYEMTTSGLTNAGGGRNGEPNRHRVSPTNFQSRNFGMVLIDWEKREVTLELCDIDGKVVDSYLAKLAATQ
jgi:alkaline phosphatase D